MSQKTANMTIEVDDFHILLKTRIAQQGRGVEGMAEFLGVTKKLVYMLLQGKRPPSKEILKKLGGRFVIAIGDMPQKSKD